MFLFCCVQTFTADVADELSNNGDDSAMDGEVLDHKTMKHMSGKMVRSVSLHSPRNCVYIYFLPLSLYSRQHDVHYHRRDRHLLNRHRHHLAAYLLRHYIRLAARYHDRRYSSITIYTLLSRRPDIPFPPPSPPPPTLSIP